MQLCFKERNRTLESPASYRANMRKQPVAGEDRLWDAAVYGILSGNVHQVETLC